MRSFALLQLALVVLSSSVANAGFSGSENGHSTRRSLRLHAGSAGTDNRRRDQIGDHVRIGQNPEGGSLQKPIQFAAQNVTWSTTPFNPTGIPLAVRSPYLSTWLWGGTHDRLGDLTAQQPSFWNGNYLPWCGTILVDGAAYTWMGVPAQCAPGGKAAVQQSLNFTSSKTTFTFTAGAVNITAAFLSPVTPKDLVRQSLPYSYLEVFVTPNDGQSHSVQVYTDITGEWASNDWTRNITWGNIILNNTLSAHTFELTDPVQYGEAADSTLYGQVVYATEMTANTTYQSGPSSNLRQAFATQGRLSNTADTDYRAISNNQPGFAFARDFGSIGSGVQASVLFVVGHYRDPGVEFSAINTTDPNRSLYFMSQYPSLESSLSFFHGDYATVSQMSAQFDSQIQSAASGNVSENYAALCAIAARQVYSGLEITVGKDASGAYNTSDVMVFVKEIATSNYVNTVDVINPAFPFLAYTNPDMIEYAILPVILYAEQTFPKNILSAPHDIGTAYPVADGAHQVDAPYYIEECANMLFMALAHAKYSGKTDLIQQHYPILRQWAEYLVNDTVYPILQSSTDDFKGRSANSTSLAVKGAVGLGCMGSIASLVGNTADGSRYNETARQYATQIVSNAMASTNDHLKLTYQSEDSSWSQLYNLYPDKIFGLGVFDDSFYSMQAAWYSKEALPYGIPLDSQSDGTKTDFSLWMAGTYFDNATLRDTFIDGVYDFLSYGSNGQAVPDYYDANNATQIGGFVNRPVVGGIYAPLLHSVPFADGPSRSHTRQKRARQWIG